jgi:Concanavalin A-like lectin/glucanases superfamily/Domain of unknown function (DUF2341)
MLPLILLGFQILFPLLHNNNVAYYRSLTLDHTQAGTADTTNYPLLFLGNASLATVANGGRVTSSSGYDIIFCTSPTSHANCLASILPFERVSWSATTGLGEFWVKVPTLSHSTNTVIYLYYGDPQITTDQQSVNATWNSGYSAVVHFPAGTSTITSSNITDSTSNGNTITTKLGSPTLAAGLIGQAYSGNTTLDTIYRPSGTYPVLTGPVSVSSWFKLASAPGSAPGTAAATVGLGASATNGRFTIFMENAIIGGNFSTQVSFGAWTWDTNWHYGVMVYPSTATSVGNVQIYLDGSAITNTTLGTGALNLQSGVIQIGANANDSANFNFPGLIDEVRVAAGITSSQVTADFNSQKSGSTFVTVGSEIHI